MLTRHPMSQMRRKYSIRLSSVTLAAAAVIGAGLAAGGCVEHVPPPGVARNDPYGREQVHIVDPDLRENTAVGAPMVSRDDAGLLLVTLPVRATPRDSDIRELHVDYRVTYFDRNGQPLNEPHWQNKNFFAGVPDQLQVNSTTPRAADFQIDLRWAR